MDALIFTNAKILTEKEIIEGNAYIDYTLQMAVYTDRLDEIRKAREAGIIAFPLFDELGDKLFIDRLYYYSKSHGEEYRGKFPDGVKFVNAVTCGWDNAGAYEEVVEWLNGRMTNYWKMIIYGSLKAHGTGKTQFMRTRNYSKGLESSVRASRPSLCQY